MNARRQALVDSIRALVDLASDQLPREVQGESDAVLPELVCAGLLAREIEIAGSVLDLEHRPADSSQAILIRSLFDHATTLAWIAAEDSADRVRRFQKTDAISRLKIEEDAEVLGETVLTPEVKCDLEAQVRSLPSGMPDLKQRAEKAINFGEAGFPAWVIRRPRLT